MTKIIITDNKVIFDGHSNTKEECENTTLLCNALKNSTDYKTIKYEDGYAELEKIGIAKELKFAGPIPYSITVDGEAFTIVRTRDDINTTWEIDASANTHLYSIDNNLIIWKERPILQYNGVDVLPTDYIHSGAAYTTREDISKVSIDLTTLSGWDNVTSGEHQISVVAKATGYLDSEKSTAVAFTKASTSTGETWVLNDILHFGTKSWSYNVNFTSNGNSYSTFAYNFSSPLEAYLVYGSTNVYDTNSYWANTAYKTITFDTAPTGDLLTWLQANGVKQGGTTAHTLTWSDSTIVVTVNGNAVTSPYTLANGDKIVLKRTSKPSYNAIITAGTDTYDTDVTSPPITINNSDILIEIGTTSPSPSLYGSFTINYTE